MTQGGANKPPLDPILAPEGPTTGPGPAPAPPVILVSRKPRPKNSRQRRDVTKYTLEEAFNYFEVPEGDYPTNCEFNHERCVRALAFLLHYVSEMGNRDVEGTAAHGLGHVLETCAADIAHTKAHRELTQPEGRK